MFSKYALKITSKNKELATTLTTKTGFKWTSDVDGIYCEAEFKLDENQRREEAENIFARKLREIGINPTGIHLESSKRWNLIKSYPDNNTIVTAKITLTSKLLSLSQELEKIEVLPKVNQLKGGM